MSHDDLEITIVNEAWLIEHLDLGVFTFREAREDNETAAGGIVVVTRMIHMVYQSLFIGILAVRHDDSPWYVFKDFAIILNERSPVVKHHRMKFDESAIELLQQIGANGARGWVVTTPII